MLATWAPNVPGIDLHLDHAGLYSFDGANSGWPKWVWFSDLGGWEEFGAEDEVVGDPFSSQGCELSRDAS